MPFHKASVSAEKEKKKGSLHMSGYRAQAPQFDVNPTGLTYADMLAEMAPQRTGGTAMPTATTTAVTAPVPIPTPTPQTDANTDREQFTAALHALASSDIDPASPQFTEAMTALLTGRTAPTQTQTPAAATPTTVTPTQTQTPAAATPPTVAPTQTQTPVTATPSTVTPTQTQTPAAATRTPAAPVQAQARADGALPTPPSGVHDKELLTKNKLMQREAFQGGVGAMPEVHALADRVELYEQMINSSTIPAANGKAFMKEMGRVNNNVSAAHEQLMGFMVQTSQAMRKASKSRLPRALTRLNPKYARAAKLADDCALLANIMQSQKIYMNKIYDDMVSAARTNPDSLRQLSGKSYAEVIRNMDMYHFSSGGVNVRKLGAGATNTVYLDRYQGRDMVFKRGKAHEYKYNGRGEKAETAFEVLRDRMGAQQEDMPSYMAEREEALAPDLQATDREDLRQKVIRDVHSANRDVAYSRLNALFGFDVAVSTQLARSEEGDTSSLMTKASGETAENFMAYAGPEQAAIIKELSQKNHAAAIAKIEQIVAQIQQDLTREKNPQILAQLREALLDKQAELEKLKKKGPARTLDLSDPRLTMQFFKMSVLDIVAGQVDRHAGNYMIDPDAEGGPRLTAIDNDTSFGTTTDIETAEQISAQSQVAPALQETFSFVPPQVKARVIEVTQTDLAQTLAGLLSKAQIDAACTRLEKLQKHLTELEKQGKVRDITAENRLETFGRNTIGNYQSALLAKGTHNAMNSSWFFQQRKSDPRYAAFEEASRRFMFDTVAYERETERKKREKALAEKAARHAARTIPSPPATQRK